MGELRVVFSAASAATDLWAFGEDALAEQVLRFPQHDGGGVLLPVRKGECVTTHSLRRHRATKRRHRRRRAQALALAAVLAVTGPAVAPVRAASSTLLSCTGSILFPESALHSVPILLDDSTDPFDRAVAAELRTRDNLGDAASILTTPVRVLGTSNGWRNYLMGELNDGGTIWSADAKTARLRGYTNDCELHTTINGRRALTLWLQPDAPKPTATTRTLHLLVEAEECGGGRTTLTGRVLTSIRVLPTRIEIAVALQPLPPITSADPTVSMAPTCEYYGPSPITVRLPVKLGRRTLINAGTYPPTLLRAHQRLNTPPSPTVRLR